MCVGFHMLFVPHASVCSVYVLPRRYIRISTEDSCQFWFTAFLAYDQAFATIIAAVETCDRPMESFT